MGKDQFERFFQDRLSNHEIPINTQDLWAGIEPTLPPKKRPLGPWLVGASVLLFLVATSLWFLSNDETEILTSELAQTHTQSTTQNLNSATEKIGSTSSSLEISNNDNNPTPDNANVQMGFTSEIETGNSTQVEGVEAKKKNSSTEDESALNPVITHAGIEKTNSTVSDASKSVRTRTQDLNTVDQELSQRGERKPTSDAVIRMAIRDQPTFGTDDAISVRFSPRVAPAQSSRISDNVESSSTGLRVEKVLNFLDSDLNTAESAYTQMSRDVLPGLNDCYDFTERWWAWGLDIYGGLHYTHKSLTGNSDNGELDAYIDARKDTESALEAYEFGVALNLMHRRGFVASVGINYSQINEEFNYLRERRETMFDSVVVRINIDSSGRVDSIRDWRPVTVQYTEEVLTYNSFRMVDIPVGLGYQFANGNMIFEIQAGLMFNLAFIKEGEILSSSLDVMEINDATFKTQVGLSGWLGVKALYPVSRRWSIYAEPIARINFVPVTVDSYNLTQRYNRFGMRLGARMAF